ncbi:MAG: fimbria major subunit, partial [Muribaculaceae bacterium]|nr:fimbria major subunit [Muribaculaceae bacterium]
IQTQTRPDLFSTSSDGTTKYFSMSNSVFYPTTESEAPQIAVQIAPNQLFNTEAAAKEALNDGTLTVNIYVERYAAKLEFQSVDPEDYVTATNPIDGSTGSNVILSFNAQTWMLNASCTDTYIVKSFREESQLSGDILADNYGYQELDDIINRTVNGTAGDWVWNSANYHRSYWGMSPAYFTSEYPEVSSDVKGITTLHQHYYSYNELINGIGGNEPVGYEVKTDGPDTHYVHETTVGSKALTSKNILAAFPSIILVGDYTIRIAGQTLTDTDFYTYLIDPSTNKPFVYFNAKEDSQVGESAIAGGESMLRGLIKAATNLYKKVDDNYENFDLTKEEELEKLVAVFEVAEPSVDVKGGLKTPERYRTLQLREGVTADQVSGIYVATADGYKTIIADKAIETPATGQLTFVETNQELMKVVGFCAKYNAGAAYFNIPVKHFGWYRSNNPNKNDTENMDWTKVRVGDFGIVRNHSYNVKVTEILGLGTGIGGKDNPIVPPAEENKYYLAYRVNILKWAVVPEQSVKL